MLMRAYRSRILSTLTMAALCVAVVLCGQPAGAGQHRKFADLDGKRIGVLNGTTFEYLVNETLDYTRLQMYSELDVMLGDLLNGKIDCIVDDEPVLRYLSARNPRLRMLDERLAEDNYGLVFRKDETDLVAQFDVVIATLQKEGLLDAMAEKWMRGLDESPAETEATTGTRLVRLGVYAEAPPFVFVTKDGKVAGLDVELVRSICRRLGFRLELSAYGEFDAIFDALEAGEVDVIAACISITEDRKRRFAFTIPYYRAGPAAMVLAD